MKKNVLMEGKRIRLLGSKLHSFHPRVFSLYNAEISIIPFLMVRFTLMWFHVGSSQYFPSISIFDNCS